MTTRHGRGDLCIVLGLGAVTVVLSVVLRVFDVEVLVVGLVMMVVGSLLTYAGWRHDWVKERSAESDGEK
ncbi:hypothetical protein [Actinokineospora cianjurensis]|uniref:hypothetical protein n=1 Tax=Actinokineospora cianjurensis TaxID=585224 RepID=UPI0011C36CAD|nr:hypothetical protein [Actinokineospora cianjurensis]